MQNAQSNATHSGAAMEKAMLGNPLTAPTLPATGFLRLPEVLRYFPVGKSTWWKGIREGRYPQPVKLGERATAWRVEDVRALIEAAGAARA